MPLSSVLFTVIAMTKAGPLWTIEELGQHVARALAASPTPSARGQVSELPTERTIRYYGTLGLLDPAVERRGLRALYGHRHLLQLVAIKRLQAEGLSLREVQERLLGLTSAKLEAIAQLPALDTPPGLARRQTALSFQAPSRRSTDFWAAIPAQPEFRSGAATVRSELPILGTQLELFQGVRLTEAVTLLLSSPRTLTPEDIEAIRVAAVPLLTTVSARGLLPPEPTR